VSSWAYLKAWPRRWTVAAFERRAEHVIRERQLNEGPDSYGR
jgi:hypothetical protein